MKKVKLTYLLTLIPILLTSSCEFIFTNEHEFTPNDLHAKVEATCTQDGHEAYYFCDDCGKYFNSKLEEVEYSSLVIPKKGHTVVVDNAVAPTCTKNGYTEGSHCSVCNAIISAQEIISSIGHTYGNWVITTNPTTTTNGIATRICSNDGTHTESYTLPNLSDTTFWSSTRVEPTCTIDGKITYTNETYGTFVITLPKFEHDYGSWSILVRPTMETTGRAERTCLNDHNHVDVVTLPVLSDETVWTKSSTLPTCEVDGRDIYTSSYGTVGIKQVKLGHEYGNWEITTYPTDSKTGKAKRVCNQDATHIETKTIPNLNEKSVWSKSVTPSTCINEGKIVYSSIYGNVEIITPTVDHTYEWVIDTPATKSETGLKHEECSICHAHRNDNTTIDIDTCDHNNLTHNAKVEATCETNGTKEYYYCSDCDKYFVDEECTNQIGDINTWKVINATGHNYGNWEITTNPTETTLGSASRTCLNNQNHKETIDIPVLSETSGIWNVVIVNPTINQKGSKTYTSIYGTVVIQLEKLNANWSDWQVTKPTNSEEGMAIRFNNDNDTEFETVTLECLNDSNSWTKEVIQEVSTTTDGQYKYTHKVTGIVINVTVKHVELGEIDL